MCDNKVSQYVPRGWDYREIKLPCGSTAVDGSQLICEECESKADRDYPQGWRHTPGDICEHGNYIGDANGADYLCGECESGY